METLLTCILLIIYLTLSVLLIFTKITRSLFYGPSGSTNDRVAILIYFKPLL